MKQRWCYVCREWRRAKKVADGPGSDTLVEVCPKCEVAF